MSSVGVLFADNKNANQKLKSFSDVIWGDQASFKWLFLAAFVLLFFALGAKEIWTQEWRWANISWNMLYSGDYLHPMLAGAAYYDKPLLSYWLMIFFSYFTGGLNEWALRLPSACAGLIAVWSIYRIGSLQINRATGLLAGWMLITCYFFVFWARTANADLLNLAGILLAIQWYFAHEKSTTFFDYLVFFTILFITALFKGLIGVVIPVLVLLPALLKNQRFKQHLNFKIVLALIMPLVVYVLPFWASSHFGSHAYAENGLYEVYRENVLRYFAPFDHQGPIYTYLIFLPVYMLPWSLFLLPAIWFAIKKWSSLSEGSKWSVMSTALVFLFLTLSGSRRNYYVLPLVPFAVLMTADWIQRYLLNKSKELWVVSILLLGFTVNLFSYVIIQPLYYSGGGLRPFATEIKRKAEQEMPWENWNIVFLDGKSKITLYLNSKKPVSLLGQPNLSKDRTEFTQTDLVNTWPVLKNLPPKTIFISREIYLEKLHSYFKNYQIVEEPLSLGNRYFPAKQTDRAIAFIPVL